MKEEGLRDIMVWLDEHTKAKAGVRLLDKEEIGELKEKLERLEKYGNGIIERTNEAKKIHNHISIEAIEAMKDFWKLILGLNPY